MVQVAKLRQAGDEDGGEGGADPGNGGETALILCQGGACVNLGGDPAFDGREMRLQDPEQSRDFPCDPRVYRNCPLLLRPKGPARIASSKDTAFAYSRNCAAVSVNAPDSKIVNSAPATPATFISTIVSLPAITYRTCPGAKKVWVPMNTNGGSSKKP